MMEAFCPHGTVHASQPESAISCTSSQCQDGFVHQLQLLRPMATLASVDKLYF